MRFHCETLGRREASPMFRALLGRYKNPEHIYTPYLQELAIFWQTPGFHETDKIRLFNRRIYAHVVDYAVEKYGNIELAKANAASVTRRDAEVMLHILGKYPTVPWWSSAMLAEDLHNGVPAETLARRFGLTVKRVKALASMWRGTSML